MEFEGVQIEKLNHASFRLKGKSCVVYIDPFGLKGKLEKADVIISTHEHYDHCSEKDIEKIIKKSTVLVGAESSCEKIKKWHMNELHPKAVVEAHGVRIEGVEAYNTDKDFHPQGLGIGVVITIDGVKVYHAGDTDYIHEMHDLEGKIDVALLPVSGTYVMNPHEAAHAAEVIKPKIAVPMHYGAIVGDNSHANAFKAEYPGKTEII